MIRPCFMKQLKNLPLRIGILCNRLIRCSSLMYFCFDLQVVLSEEENPDPSKYLDGTRAHGVKRHPVDLDLELVLGKMPRKVRITQ